MSPTVAVTLPNGVVVNMRPELARVVRYYQPRPATLTRGACCK